MDGTAVPAPTLDAIFAALLTAFMSAAAAAGASAAEAATAADSTASAAAVRRIHGARRKINFIRLSIQFSNTLGRRNDVGQPDAEFVVDDDDFALGNQTAVHEHVHRLAGHSVEFDDGTLRKLQ